MQRAMMGSFKEQFRMKICKLVFACLFVFCFMMVTASAVAQVPPAALNYRQLDVPTSASTELDGVNAMGEIIGFFFDNAGRQHGLIRRGSIFSQFDVPGSTATQVLSINDAGTTVGMFSDAAGASHGFIDKAGSFTQVNFPGVASTDANGLNAAGFLVGDFFDAAGVEHGYTAVPQ